MPHSNPFVDKALFAVRRWMTMRLVTLMIEQDMHPSPIALDLRDSEPRPEVIGLLYTAPTLASVRTLDLRATEFDDADAARLADSPLGAGLTTLRLQCNHLTAAGVAALGTIATLTTLDLRHNAIGPAGAAAIAAATFTPHLRRLYLYSEDVDDAGEKTLYTDPRIPRHIRRLWEARSDGEMYRYA